MVLNGHTTSAGPPRRRLSNTGGVVGGAGAGGGSGSTEEEEEDSGEGGMMEDVEEDSLVEARPWSDAWYDFCLTNPIRGLRQITESTPFTIRRIFWLSFIIAGAAIFAYQMLNSILYYRSGPMAMDVRVHYNTSLKFPAVTLCNQNAFRMTVAAKNNWYTGLTKLYSGNLDMASLKNMVIANTTMEKILRAAAHRRQDLIVQCNWDQHACGPEDFHPSPTPMGMCYTFNSGYTGALHATSGTGPTHGLRLLLNIEQYEYMHGPNEAAGITIAIHDQQVAPPLPVQSMLVSPGEHAVISLSVLQVRRVPLPHGTCSNTIAEDANDISQRSVPTCVLHCKAQKVRASCGCIDSWFPMDLRGGLKSCDVKSYQSCVLRVLATANFSPSACGCINPCHELFYESQLSHAAISSREASSILFTNKSQQIQHHYLKARETAERTVEDLKTKNTDLIIAVTQSLEEVSFSLERVDGQLADGLAFLDSLVEEMQPRINFHQTRALKGVKYITQHNFIKGWEIMNDRTLDHVTTEFYETVSAFDRTVAQLQQTPEEEVTIQRIIFFMMDRDLSSRLEIAIRAVDNLTKAYYAYLNAEPLLEYVLTPNGRYDLSLIPADILAHNTRKQREYYNKMSEHLTGYIDSILGLQYVLKEYHRNKAFNDTAYQDCKQSFIYHAKQVNYYKTLFEQRIIHRAKDIIEQKFDQFDRISSRFYSKVDDLKSILAPLQARLRKQYEMLQADLVLFSQMAKTFLNSDSVSKQQLASMAHSKRTFGMVNSLKVLFSDIRAQAANMAEWWRRLEELYTDIWRSFLKETSVKQFYLKLKEDIVEMVKNPDKRTFFLEIFADSRMLHTTLEDLNQTSVKNLTRMLNADFPDIGFKHKENEITTLFNRIEDRVTFVNVLGDTDSRFLSAFHDLDKDLREYTNGILVNKEFVRENLLQLDVHFHDLSYEIAEERVIYDLTQLLSDIGGSLALFLGASAMAVFEILDFLMHTAALKCYVNKHQKHKHRTAAKRHQQHNTYDAPPGLRNPEKIHLSPRPRVGPRMELASAEGANGGTYERPDCNKYMPRVAVSERSPGHQAHRNISLDDTAV